jgi:hypothetical protein
VVHLTGNIRKIREKKLKNKNKLENPENSEKPEK